MKLPDKENTPSAGGPPQAPPILPPESERKQKEPSGFKSGSGSHSLRAVFAVVLSLCLGLFLVDAVVSLLDDSLIWFAGTNAVSSIRGLVGLLAFLMSVGVYLLMGLTPMVPKKLFLPVALFPVVATLVLLPVIIYDHGRVQAVSWAFSLGQVLVGAKLLVSAQGGFKFRWPLVPVTRLNARRFSWLNLGGFALVNVFVVAPAIFVYGFVCTSRAVDHFTDGFMTMHANGFSVQVRQYRRDDGKTIELFPMVHVADAAFYRRVERTFPTNSIILMEGVTDNHNLLTNKISYARMARTLGLAQQQRQFIPTRGKIVRADVDVDQFSPDTIHLLNLIMLLHVKGVTPENVMKLMEFSPSPKMQKELMDDLLRDRNRHLVKEIKMYLKQTDHLMVPWGVAHMPGIARAIQGLGFRLVNSQNYMVIRF